MVRHCGVLHYRQPQSRAAELTRPPFVHPVKAFKDASEVLRLHPLTVVTHGEFIKLLFVTVKRLARYIQSVCPLCV